MSDIESVLDFYQKFSDYESIGNMSFIDSKSSAFQLSMKVKAQKQEVSVSSKEGLSININNQMAAYINNKLSPIIINKNKEGELEDINKLLISLALTKIFFEDKEEWVYMPLISIDISKEKKQIAKALKSGLSTITLPWESELIFNEAVISTLFDITYEENGENINEYISDTLADLIPEDNRINLESIIETIYSIFKGKEKGLFKLVYPQLNSEKSAIFMFFNNKNNIKLKKEYSSIAKNPTNLTVEYLTFKQEENFHPSFNNELWLGSLTKDFPLGKGQGIVMQQNALNKRIIPVEGGPGTGKTTLFLSLIANEVTSRAINLAEGNSDYNNMILVTSTSNKAIENVYSSLKSGFKHGFCYIGGNSTNKAASAVEVAEYIEFLNEKEYSPEKQNFHRTKILDLKSTIYKKEIIFNKVKKLNLNFKSYKEAKRHLDNIFLVDSFLTKEYLFKLGKKLNIQELDYTLILKSLTDLKNSFKISYFSEEIKKGFFLNFFKKNSILNEFNREFNLNVNSQKDMEFILNELNNFSLEDITNFSNSLLSTKIKLALDLVSNKEKFFNGIMNNETFADYFRTNLFSMNYSLYISSINFMNQEILRNKEEIIKALSYFTSDNGYKYIVDNYGYSKSSQEKFLRFISMAYPVITSTLAAINGMFNDIMKVQCKFRTILADESGMISSNAILPALNMAERAIIVGDPKQLEPIVPIQEIFMTALKKEVSSEFWNTYSPTQVSAYHRAAGTLEGGFKSTGRGIVLDEHRRCAPKIANLFINIADYKGLNVHTPTPNSKQIKAIGENLMFFDVKNVDQETFKKVNLSEVSKISTILDRLEAVGYNLKSDVGIITPYKDQESVLIEAFAKRLNHTTGEDAKIGTVHKFQGVEYKIILFSTVLSRPHDSLGFVNKSPSLINVAISRAKEGFFVIGDYKKLTEDSSYDNYIGRMSREIKLNGKLVLTKKIVS